MLVAGKVGAVIGVMLALPATAEAAARRMETREIRATVEHFVASQARPGVAVQAVADRLDERLALPACVGELTPYLAPGAVVRPRTSVGVRCPDPGGWSIFVPVTVTADVPVLVAKRTLSRGEVPATGDLLAVTRRVPGLGARFPADAADIVGHRLRRAVAAGQPVPADALEPPVLVARGQQVTFVAQLAGIAVRAGAIALDAGGHGDRIRARNAVSGRIVEGTVQADGTVASHP
jgi:flagella basal body P-ring formation protein FlgA